MANEQDQQRAENDGTKKTGGGATGYDVNREQKPIKKEGEHMHNERNEDDLNVEEKQPAPNEKERIPPEKPKDPQQ